MYDLEGPNIDVCFEGFNVNVYLGGIASGTCASGFGVCCVCMFLRLIIPIHLQLI